MKMPSVHGDGRRTYGTASINIENSISSKTIVILIYRNIYISEMVELSTYMY